MMYAKSRPSASRALEALDTAEKIDPKFELTYIYRGSCSRAQAIPQALHSSSAERLRDQSPQRSGSKRWSGCGGVRG